MNGSAPVGGPAGLLAAVLLAAAVVLLVPPRGAPGRVLGGGRGTGTPGSRVVGRHGGAVGGVTGSARVGGAVLLGLLGLLGLVVAGLPARVVVLGLVTAAVTGAGGLLLGLRRTARAAAATGERTREVCEAIADDLAAGTSAERALLRAAAGWPALDPVLAAHQVGSDVPAAWRAVAGTHPGAEGLRLVAAAWQVSGRTGQGLSRALHRVAADLRAAASTRRAVDSELASARATGRLVAGLPALAWLMGSGAGQHPLAWLLAGPAGWVCLAVGLGLLLLGLTWVELLARGAVAP